LLRQGQAEVHELISVALRTLQRALQLASKDVPQDSSFVRTTAQVLPQTGAIQCWTGHKLLDSDQWACSGHLNDTVVAAVRVFLGLVSLLANNALALKLLVGRLYLHYVQLCLHSKAQPLPEDVTVSQMTIDIAMHEAMQEACCNTHKILLLTYWQ